ncbi:MAG: cobyrinate a,c-diamide synthase [Halanaerobium sp.]
MNKRVVIAGSRSGVGKTTITLGLMAALKNKGLRVQPFKVGPDYIDPGFHSLVCGRNSCNLDSYFLEENGVRSLFSKKSKAADISLVEGVMGLFDGKGKDAVSSTAEIARIIKAPVILVIDARKVAQSAAALVYGYKNYDQKLNLKGLIINNVSSRHHFQLLKEAVEAKMSDIKILGYLPKIEELELPERHLGLVPVSESRELKKYIQKLTVLMEEHIDLESVIEIAAAAEKFTAAKRNLSKNFNNQFINQVAEAELKIGIASDQAFNFYYQSNFDLLKEAGAEIVEISPLNDSSLPEVDAFYLGGGFPESFLEELAANSKFKNDLKAKIREGLPTYAECGGLMYLCSSVKNFEGKNFEMLNLISAEIEMTSKLQEMGYREVRATADNLLFKKGERARGHVFHYSKIVNLDRNLKKTYCYRNKEEGYSSLNNLLASYVHLHFGSNPELVKNFLLQALAYKKNRGV